jgi:hypothetical protein
MKGEDNSDQVRIVLSCHRVSSIQPSNQRSWEKKFGVKVCSVYFRIRDECSSYYNTLVNRRNYKSQLQNVLHYGIHEVTEIMIHWFFLIYAFIFISIFLKIFNFIFNFSNLNFSTIYKFQIEILCVNVIMSTWEYSKCINNEN